MKKRFFGRNFNPKNLKNHRISKFLNALYTKLAWLNNEPVVSTKEKNFENSFYNQRRLILKHLELGIPFESQITAEKSIKEKFEIPVPEKFELEVPEKLASRLEKTRKEIADKLGKLEDLLSP